LIAEVKSVAVYMALSVFSIKGETNPGCLANVLVDLF
jgi:hypothetical protein